jgi:hypothetical protein
MREVERCTDVTNAVVGEADGAPCWQSERHRFGWGWRGEVLRSYCADVIDGRLAAGWATRFLNSRFDSGCFVKVFVELLDMTVSKAFSFESMFCESVGSPQRGVSGAGV